MIEIINIYILLILAILKLPLWYGIVEDYIKDLAEFIEFFSTHTIAELDLEEAFREGTVEYYYRPKKKYKK